MLKKSLVVAAITATVATATLSTQASAGGDPVLGALVGAGIGAAIGHNINGPHGAWVGGALGAVTGASIVANSGGYYDRGYYGRSTYYEPAPAYYGPSVSYYAPAPVYYGPPAVVYRSAPVYVRSYQPRYVGYGRSYGYARSNWRDHGGRRDDRGGDRRGH